MFLQVRFSTSDGPPLSFLWYHKANVNQGPEVYELNVHRVGARSSQFCATFPLRQTAKDNQSAVDVDIPSALLNNFYVDDCLISVATVAEARRMVEQLTSLLGKGGFCLHKWVSNRPGVLSGLLERERASDFISLDFPEVPVQKTLGLYWCVKTDCFKFKVNLPTRSATKRGTLSCTYSLFDPLGFLAPVLLQPKRMLQSLCRKGLGWDEPVDETTKTAWLTWQSVLQSVEYPRKLWDI